MDLLIDYSDPLIGLTGLGISEDALRAEIEALKNEKKRAQKQQKVKQRLKNKLRQQKQLAKERGLMLEQAAQEIQYQTGEADRYYGESEQLRDELAQEEMEDLIQSIHDQYTSQFDPYDSYDSYDSYNDPYANTEYDIFDNSGFYSTGSGFDDSLAFGLGGLDGWFDEKLAPILRNIPFVGTGVSIYEGIKASRDAKKASQLAPTQSQLPLPSGETTSTIPAKKINWAVIGLGAVALALVLKKR